MPLTEAMGDEAMTVLDDEAVRSPAALPVPRAGRFASPVSRLAAASLSLAALALLPAFASAGSAPDTGKAFAPAPKSEPVFGTQTPDVQPASQRKTLQAADGTDLFVETWLPAPLAGATPPERVPTVLIATPYVKQNTQRYTTRNLDNVVTWFTSRGYAVAQHHIRGTGESGGCLEQTAAQQISDVAIVIEWLGEDAPWTNRAVGMYGHSYDAETQVSVAGLGDREKVESLKAIVPSATVGGQYEYSNRDGVPFAGQATLSNALYLGTTSAIPGDNAAPVHYAEKGTCFPELLVGGAEPSGDLTDFWARREYRPGAGNITAATLWVHGLRDFNVQPVTIAGFFDRLPKTTPRAGLFGVWDHNYPDKHARVEPDWAREDFLPMVTAWYDKFLKGLDTDVERWPRVQVQASDGQWRAEPEFPRTGGPAGQLALGAGGTLGATAPTGSTTFEELHGTVTFTTPKLDAPLHLTGVPVADLWLRSDRDDAHLSASLDVLGPDGAVLLHAGGGTSSARAVATYGYRSLRHLDAMPDGYFQQREGRPAPVNTPVRVPVRFLPTDLVVPEGGRLRLTIGGEVPSPSTPLASGSAATIELLHDCGTPSALRFLMPRAGAQLLDVREIDDDEELGEDPAAGGPVRDGGRLARARICGEAARHGLLARSGPPLRGP